MNKTLRLLSLQVSKHLRCFRLFLLTLLLCSFMQTMAETWTDRNGLTWSFTVNGTEAMDIKFYSGPNSEKIYIYGDPNRSEEEKAADPQLPFVPGAWDAAAMRFSNTEGAHLPTIPDDVYFNLKTLIFDVSDVTEDFDLKVMNGWWSNTYYDHVKWENGLNELQITEIMANECAKAGQGRDLDLMLYSGSMTFNAVYYESSIVSGAMVIPAKVYAGSTELTVTSIGNYAFSGCSGMTSITIPNSVISIGSSAFSGCSGLTSVTIPNSVISIGNFAFSGCSGLTSILIPNSVTSIGDAAFSGCSGLTSITIPNSVISIGNSAFSRCSGLTSVAIPNSVTSIGDYAFSVCSSLTSITIPNSVTSIGNGAFSDCSGLTSITIPNSVTSIGEGAFSYCSGLTSFTIPNSVISIGYAAFAWCSRLTSITIPNSVTSIEEYAFYGCTGLTSINVGSGNTKYDSRDNCNAIIETKSNTLIAGCKNTNIPNSVTSIGYAAFYYCIGLTSITIPNSVTSIGEYAFASCFGLTSITIPNSVTSIGNYAFAWCNGLTSITIPNSVTSIGEWAFASCSGLTSITIPNSVTSIGEGAFSYCSGLKKVHSEIEEPFAIRDNVFWYYDSYNGIYRFTPAKLYVPVGTIAKYEATDGWKNFETIVEPGPETVTVGNTLVAGFSSNKDLDFEPLKSKGVSAWIATGFDKGNVLLGRVYRVSAGEGVYVKADKAGTYQIPETNDEAFYMNMFVGVPNGKTVDMYENFYGETYLTLSLAVSKTTGKPGFFPNTAPKTYGKNKMYLHMPARLLPEYAQTRINDFELGIEFEDDEATGISEAELFENEKMRNGENEKRGEVYNLNGQRLVAPHKGLNIIGGKKVVIK